MLVNGGIYPNPVSLNFSISSTAMLGQFGNVGYNLDGGIINSVSSFINKSLDYNPTDAPAWYFYNTTVFASVVLPPLTEGVHNVTVYFGWQYLGTAETPSLQRYEVSSLATSNFTVGEINLNSESPPQIFSTSYTTLIVVTAVVAICVIVILGLLYKLKKDRVKTILASKQRFL